MDDLVVVASVDGILEIRFNRPEKKNALTRGMYEAVRAALEHADADPAILLENLKRMAQKVTRWTLTARPE